ncbi:MAG: ABC transporter permease [Desulfobacteraceae bacterium]|jgi:peptide/nickel transport system permease protein|nr:ABC transporter permease [Desulfobacteraceae bacterium]
MVTIVQKLVRLLLVMLAVTAVTFLMVNCLPGDAAFLIGGEMSTGSEIEAIRAELGLDRPVGQRYLSWLGDVLQGELGRSYLTHESVARVIGSRLPVTLELIVVSQAMALLLALPAGILSAYRKGTPLDRGINGVAFATFSVPGFVMSLVAIYVFAIRLDWLPATGYTPLVQDPWANLKSFVLPGLSIALIEWVVLMRVLRSDLIGTLQQDFILMARAKGLPPWKVLLQHALRPSSFTLITILGLQVGRLLGEAVIVETIFALPGIGRLLIDAIYARDALMVQGCVLVITAGYVAVNTGVDVLYGVLDPRIRCRTADGR